MKISISYYYIWWKNTACAPTAGNENDAALDCPARIVEAGDSEANGCSFAVQNCPVRNACETDARCAFTPGGCWFETDTDHDAYIGCHEDWIPIAIF